MSAPAYTDGLLLAAWEAAQQAGDLHVIELGVLMALARHSDEQGRSWPSIKALAAELRIKYQHAAGALQGLERRRLITTSKNTQLTVYQLMCVPPKQQAPAAPRRRDGVLSRLIKGEAGQAPAQQRPALRLVGGAS